MGAPKPMQIKILGAKDQMDELHKFAKDHPTDLKVQSYGPEKDPTNLKFGLAEISTLIGTIPDVLSITVLAIELYQLLKPTDGRRIIVQTPMKRVELVSHKDLTQAEVEAALKQLVKAAT